MSKSWKIAKIITWISYVLALFCVLFIFDGTTYFLSIFEDIATREMVPRISAVLIWVFGGISLISAIIQAWVREEEDEYSHVVALILVVLLLFANLWLTALAFFEGSLI